MMHLFHEEIPRSKCINLVQIDPQPNKAPFSNRKLGLATYIHVLAIKTSYVIKINHVILVIHVILDHKSQSCHFKFEPKTLSLYTFFFEYFFMHYTLLPLYDLSIEGYSIPTKKLIFLGKRPTSKSSPSETRDQFSHSISLARIQP